MPPCSPACIRQVSIHVPARGTTVKDCSNCDILFVSIHVPARGTTQQNEPASVFSFVSIHVPARGTTFTWLLFGKDSLGFNPRSRTGNDCNHPQISFVLFALTYAIIPINFVQHNLQHAFLLTSPQNHGANPPGILCSLQTRTTLSLRCFLLEITKTSTAPHHKSTEIKLI